MISFIQSQGGKVTVTPEEVGGTSEVVADVKPVPAEGDVAATSSESAPLVEEKPEA